MPGDHEAEASVRGLWRERPGQAPTRVLDGSWLSSAVSPDGRLIAAIGRPRGWLSLTYTLTLLDADTGKVRDEVPLGGSCRLAGFAGAGPVLTSGDEAHLYELDAKKLIPFPGEVAPFREGRWRAWQPASTGAVWVAIPTAAGDEGTRVGRYDPRTFTFTETNSFPFVNFGSMDMWIDEAARTIYALERGKVLKLRLLAD